MSAYTEAHFACALLSCGPHVTACAACVECGSEGCPNLTLYRNSVNRCFNDLFPMLASIKYNSTPEREFRQFWTEYCEWVNYP